MYMYMHYLLVLVLPSNYMYMYVHVHVERHLSAVVYCIYIGVFWLRQCVCGGLFLQKYVELFKKYMYAEP